jgi:hypothetical protein
VDGTRARRTLDQALQAWYARHRQRRFTRFLGFGDQARDPASPRRLCETFRPKLVTALSASRADRTPGRPAHRPSDAPELSYRPDLSLRGRISLR